MRKAANRKQIRHLLVASLSQLWVAGFPSTSIATFHQRTFVRHDRRSLLTAWSYFEQTYELVYKVSQHIHYQGMLPPPSTPRSTAVVAFTQAAFHYRVVCEDGAYVRAGLELSSRHLYTIGSQSTIEVLERCVNNQGLARLRTRDGWISEMLNPLSGQRGPIVELVPLQHPLKFRITFPDGALVRSGIELSSGVVGTIPAGQEIVVTEKRFSDTPSYRCVPRLKLADGLGWISMRINSPPPSDADVVELLGLACSREVDNYSTMFDGLVSVHGAGMLDGEGDESIHGYQDGGSPLDVTSGERRGSLSMDLSVSEPQPVGKNRRTRYEQQRHQQGQIADMSEKIRYALQPASAGIDEQSGTATSKGDQYERRRTKEDHSCLVCFSACRNATFVHGESGHIACCLECARVLKGRGDPCPVCRLPVDSVIQHFWA